MPVAPGSRYHGLESYEAADAAGEPHATLAIRPVVPPAPDAAYGHIVVAGESLEYLAWRYYGVSTSWWRLADGGPATFPLDLAPGAVVAVPASDGIGRAERTRRF